MHSAYPYSSASTHSPSSVTERFFAPLEGVLATACSTRSCPAVPDEEWIKLGVRRSIELVHSGRDFLQRFGAGFQRDEDEDVRRSSYFEAFKSERRLSHLTEIAESLAARMATRQPDALAESLPWIRDFEVFAGDGHWHGHAARDAVRHDGKKYAVGHLYALNLRSGALSHLSTADETNRLKEHDMRALKRMDIDTLRQGTPRGRKTLWIWDRAGIDFRQWHHWKNRHGIYFLSRKKDNMKFDNLAADLDWNSEDLVNIGVLHDQLCGSSCGTTVRWVKYRDPATGELYDFITNLTDASIPPGAIVQLFRMRWDIEKVFDELKNKLGETKAWASSQTAKTMQAKLICVARNLMWMLEFELEKTEGIRNEAELRRQAKRIEKLKAGVAKRGQRLPKLYLALQRITQISVKFIRWLRCELSAPDSEPPCLGALRKIYATP